MSGSLQVFLLPKFKTKSKNAFQIKDIRRTLLNVVFSSCISSAALYLNSSFSNSPNLISYSCPPPAQFMNPTGPEWQWPLPSDLSWVLWISPHIKKRAEPDHWGVTCSISQSLFCARPHLQWHHNTHHKTKSHCLDPSLYCILCTACRGIFNQLLIITGNPSNSHLHAAQGLQAPANTAKTDSLWSLRLVKQMAQRDWVQ